MEWAACHGGRYADALGIDLRGASSREIFQWFLASILYGARISETLATRTWRAFRDSGVMTPEAIVAAGWDRLVEILDRGGYVRYDYKTATKLLDVCRALLAHYDGDLSKLHGVAASPADLEARVMALGNGIGPVTANIFLRELRGIWSKAQPLLADPALEAAYAVGFLSRRVRNGRRALALLQQRWRAAGGKDRDFSDFEAALVRYGVTARRRARSAHREQ